MYVEDEILTPWFSLQSTYFSRHDVALPGFAKLFRKNSDEEREHAFKLVEYQNMRGGTVVFRVIIIH